MSILDYVSDIFRNLENIIASIRIFEVIELFVLAVIVYLVIRFVRETRAEQLIKGIIFFVIILFIFKIFKQTQFKVLGALSDIFLNVGFVAVVVMFQPELRRVLERVGRSSIIRTFSHRPKNDVFSADEMIDALSDSCAKLSRMATGALIVIERETKLGEQIESGTVIDSAPSDMLLRNLFFKNSPLHDGAVIIRNNRIYAAGCMLPKPQSEARIPRDLGTRHRAAVGISEIGDSISVVVSEETGVISIVEGGVIKRGFDGKSLANELSARLIDKKTVKSEKKSSADAEKEDGFDDSQSFKPVTVSIEESGISTVVIPPPDQRK